MSEGRLKSLLVENRRAILAAVHMGFFLLAYWLAFMLRFEFDVPRRPYDFWARFLQTLPVIISIKLVVFAYYGMFSGWWRYVGTRDLVTLAKACTLSTLVFIAVMLALLREGLFPRSVYLLDWMITGFLVGGSRFSLRALREIYAPAGGSGAVTKLFIVGAGDAGEGLLREILRRPHLGYSVQGFIDDDPAKRGSVINGVHVLGSVAEMGPLASARGVEEVLIAIPSATGADMRRIASGCKDAGLRFRTLPGIDRIIDGRVAVSMLRPVEIEDLLRREPVPHDAGAAARLVQDRVVLVTGAGGSIGSELCRQIARLGPRELVMLDRSENAIFEIDRELRVQFPSQALSGYVADIRSSAGMRGIMERHRPSIVFHAAAHKHVPLMERTPAEAIRNNVLGTRDMMELSVSVGVERFVFISSDKAVLPASVMGATKRLAEMLVLSGAPSGRSEFVAVRFGNVLGSSGSVVPIFRRQIESGGPVTVTHPEMRRFFMTIPEAVELVLQAAAIGRPGRVMALEMGEPVKVVDLAEDLIRLSGLVPWRDIEITYTGIRPGEKLSEEITAPSEQVERTEHASILCVRSPVPDRETISAALSRLADIADDRIAPEEVRSGLFSILAELEKSAASGRTPGGA